MSSVLSRRGFSKRHILDDTTGMGCSLEDFGHFQKEGCAPVPKNKRVNCSTRSVLMKPHGFEDVQPSMPLFPNAQPLYSHTVADPAIIGELIYFTTSIPRPFAGNL